MEELQRWNKLYIPLNKITGVFWLLLMVSSVLRYSDQTVDNAIVIILLAALCLTGQLILYAIDIKTGRGRHLSNIFVILSASAVLILWIYIYTSSNQVEKIYDTQHVVSQTIVEKIL